MGSKYTKSIWGAFIVAIALTAASSWNVSYLVTDNGNKQEVSQLEGKINQLEEQMEGIRNNRDILRANSLNCSVAFRDLANVIEIGRLDQDDLEEARTRIVQYKKECLLVTDTGVGKDK